MQEIADQTVFALSDGVSVRELGPGEGAVVLILATGQLYTCNDTAVAFLSAVNGVRGFAGIVDELGRKFDVPPGDLGRDLSALAGNLMAEGIIKA
jgi:pyrroloquinoline quinone biosynthesis protein D